MIKTTFITGVVALLLLLVSPSTAEIKTLTITSERRPLIFVQRFGFTHTGHVAITVSSVSVAAAASKPDPSRIGFILLSKESLPKVIIETKLNPTFFCILHSHYSYRLLTFHHLSLPHTPFNRTYPVTSPSEYSFFFANCNNNSSLTVTVKTEFFNLNPDDGSRNYLSFDQTHLPSLFFVFSITYLLFLTFWLYLCHVSKHSLHSIHLLMASLLLSKAVSIFCAAADKHYVKVTGTSHGWDVVVLIFDFIHVVLLFTVIVLVGTRWTFLHPFVRERGKKVLFIVIPLQVLAHVAYVVVHNTGPYIKDWVTWNQLFLLPDFYSCCAVLLLIVWSVRSFTEGKNAIMNFDKFRVMWRFYIVVICYLFIPRFLLFAPEIIFVYEYRWVTNLVEECAGLVFCIVMFYVFMLLEKDEYSVIGDEIFVKE